MLAFKTFCQPDLKRGLVAYYPFNGNAKDESGNNQHPDFSNVSFISDKNGNGRSAVEFNGKSQYICIPNSPSLNFAKSFSISAYVKVSGFYSGKCHGNRIIMKGANDYQQGNYYLTFDDNYYTKGQNCNNTAVDKQHQTFYGPYTSNIEKKYVVTGKWYLLTYTCNGQTAKLYIDCDLYGSGSVGGNRFSNSDDLFFGKLDNDEYPYWFNGALDEVRIYNRELSADEVTALCSLNTPPATVTPEAAFDYTITNCNKLEAKLTKNVALKKYQWLLDGKNIGNSIKCAAVLSAKGSHTLKLIATGTDGKELSIVKNITVAAPDADFNYTLKKEPAAYQFSIAGKQRHQYAWYINNSSAGNKKKFTRTFETGGTYSVRLEATDKNGCRSVEEKDIVVTIPVTAAAEPVTTVLTLPATPLVADTAALQLPEKRITNRQQEIEVVNDSVTVVFYDNAEVDGDSVTVVYNNKIIALHQRLSDKPVRFTLPVLGNSFENELIMYAENLGSIPPNTALMLVFDGEKRYEITMSSNNTANSSVVFKLKR
jgi:hypothetical protein